MTEKEFAVWHVFTGIRLSNPRKPELEPVKANALAYTGALIAPHPGTHRRADGSANRIGARGFRSGRSPDECAGGIYLGFERFVLYISEALMPKTRTTPPIAAEIIPQACLNGLRLGVIV